MTNIETLTITPHTLSDEIADSLNQLKPESVTWSVKSLPIDQKSLPRSGFILTQWRNGSYSLEDYDREENTFSWTKSGMYLADSDNQNYRRVHAHNSYHQLDDPGHIPILYNPNADKKIPLTFDHPGSWKKYFDLAQEGDIPNIAPVFEYLSKHKLNLPIVGINRNNGQKIAIHLRPQYNSTLQPLDYLVELSRQTTAKELARYAVMLSQPNFLSRLLASELEQVERFHHELKRDLESRTSKFTDSDLNDLLAKAKKRIKGYRNDIDLAHWLITSGYMTSREKNRDY